MQKLRWFIIAGLLFFVISLVGGYRVSSQYQSAIFDDISLIPGRRVALVLGAGLNPNGLPSDALADRVKTAVALYQAGKVEKLLMSGDNGRVEYDEVTAMKKLAVALGVPEADVVLDYAGFRTYDSCYRASAIFSLSEAIIVTQRFHLPRALYTCNAFGVASVGMVADKQSYVRQGWWSVREIAAQIVAFWQVKVWRMKPRYLGEKVPL